MELARAHEEVFEYVPESPSAPHGVIKGALVRPPPRLETLPTPTANENIETVPVDARRAMNVFIRREEEARTTTGQCTKFEPSSQTPVSGERPGEPLDQRCSRLQVECMELLKCCESASLGDAATRADLIGADPVEVASELRALEKTLRNWKKITPGAAEEGKTSSGGPGALHKSLVEKLDELAGSTEVSAVPNVDGQVTWELNYVPSTIPIIVSARLGALDSRIAALENKIGAASSTAETANELYNNMLNLHRRIGLLDTQRLDSLRVIAAKAKSGLEQAAPHKQELQTDKACAQKVKELYSGCHRWLPAASSLPNVVSRMQSLESLHQAKSSFTLRLAALESEQDEVIKMMEFTAMAVQEMFKGMQENMLVFKENMDKLEAKLDKKMKRSS